MVYLNISQVHSTHLCKMKTDIGFLALLISNPAKTKKIDKFLDNKFENTCNASLRQTVKNSVNYRKILKNKFIEKATF